MKSLKAIARQVELLARVLAMAKEAGWMLSSGPGRRQVCQFTRRSDIVTVSLEDMTVVSTILHPIHGRARLTRKDVDLGTLGRIFQDPRVHTLLGIERREVGRHAPARSAET
jgi:hypothetical protein